MEISLYRIRDHLTEGTDAFGVRLEIGGEHLDIDCESEAEADSLLVDLGELLAEYRHSPVIKSGDVVKEAGW